MSRNCWLFTVIMNRKAFLLAVGLVIFLFSIWRLLTLTINTSDDFNEVAKIAIRDVGNQLLLAYNDSTSVVKPIIEIEPLKYNLSFQNELAIVPDSLVSQIKRSIDKSNLPSYYRVEVKDCLNDEVAYSYEMRDTQENGIVPCGGRLIKEGCYNIQIKFLEQAQVAVNNNKLTYYLLLITGLGLLFFGFFGNMSKNQAIDTHDSHVTFGSFHFYPEQNKLVKQATEISLSKKECEILALFVERPNKVIKRDELTKAVWEDNGVIVGRSLDTYISKLRKKLQDDESIKITNVHGVGYKLEVN